MKNLLILLKANLSFFLGLVFGSVIASTTTVMILIYFNGFELLEEHRALLCGV